MLIERGYGVRAAVRQPGDDVTTALQGAGPDHAVVGEINEVTDWSRALVGVTGVIHLAGRAHVMRERLTDPLPAYRRINVVGTLRLAEAAVAAGVHRFVFVSSIGVNGAVTAGRPFSEQDPPHPHSPYSMSKWEAEQCLRKIERRTGLEVVIVRPPLVYGPGAKGNFLRLLQWISRGMPLPFGACTNKRTLVALYSLVDLLERCVSDPRAAGHTFLAGDAEDFSTPELIRRAAFALGRPARLIAVPPAMLKVAARALGRAGMYDQLCGSLQVDIGHAQRVLGWVPLASIDEELARTAKWFATQGARA